MPKRAKLVHQNRNREKHLSHYLSKLARHSGYLANGAKPGNTALWRG